MRIQAQGGLQIELTGTVDSGATRTALSREDAEQLGLRPKDLRAADPVIVADGSEVASWTATVPIRGQVLRVSSSGVDLLPWGPVFEIDPIFLEDGSPLWGQADFFKSFEITFQRYMNPARFILNHWQNMSQSSPPQ